MLAIEFKNRQTIKLYVGRLHEWYETNPLNGELFGINCPIETYNKWLTINKISLSDREKIIDKIIQKNNPAYIVGYEKGDINTKLHEIAHYIYYSDDNYRNIVLSEWNKLDTNTLQYITRQLKLLGYSDKNIIDEFQAYIIENPRYFGSKIDISVYKLFKQYITKYNLKSFLVEIS